MNTELAPILGPIASPANTIIRRRRSGLEIRQSIMDVDLENVTALTEDGSVDMVATEDRAVHYNNTLIKFNEDAGLLTIDTEGASQLDGVNVDMVEKLILHWRIYTWVWYCPNVPNRRRTTGPFAARVLHLVVRFGDLTLREIYTLCGRVYGEQTVCYAYKHLVTDRFLIKGKLGRAYLLKLGRKVKRHVLVFGDRDNRDEVAFEAAMQAGRVIIASRRR
jgi:hypothetical protein